MTFRSGLTKSDRLAHPKTPSRTAITQITSKLSNEENRLEGRKNTAVRAFHINTSWTLPSATKRNICVPMVKRKNRLKSRITITPTSETGSEILGKDFLNFSRSLRKQGNVRALGGATTTKVRGKEEIRGRRKVNNNAAKWIMLKMLIKARHQRRCLVVGNFADVVELVTGRASGK